MITRHYKRIVKDILQRGGAKYDAYAVTASDGRPYYTAQEPPNYSVDQTAMSMSTDQPGVIIGRGTAAESETSYWLQQQITSGFSGSVLPTHEMVDGTHTLCLYVTITNTESSSIIVSEIGYALITPLMRRPSDSQTIGSPYAVERNVLIDRTVLASPITIAEGNSVRLKYALKTTDEIFSGSAVLIQKTINVNGVYNASSDNADGYSEVTVSVTPNLQSKTVTENGTVTPDQGYDGLSSVVVNVSGGGGALSWRDTLSVNWDFANPVNTRGKSSYSGSSMIYTLDGWQLQGGILTFVQGGIKLSRYAAGTAGFFMQRLKRDMTTAIVGRTITLSAMVDGVINSATASPVPSASGNSGFSFTCSGVSFRGYGYGTEIAITIDIAADTDDHVIQAIKLEAGSNQTLATQVNGVWMLNNSMDANTEYIKARNGTVYNS